MVFDPAALDGLTGHVADRRFALVFVAGYRRMLPERVRRIEHALCEGDLDAAMDAVLSLKVSSSMVGAGELRALGCRIERRLRREDLPAAMTVAGRLVEAAARADRALGDYLAA